MDNLPKDRVEPCFPFLKVGLHYFGHLFVKESGKRSKRKTKVWVALFVCLVTQAVHSVIVSELSIHLKIH